MVAVALSRKQFLAELARRGIPTTRRQVEHAILTGRVKPRRVAGWWSFGARQLDQMAEYRRTVRAGRPPWKNRKKKVARSG